MKKNIILHAVRNAILMFAYVTAVGLFMSNASHILGEKDTVFTPVAALMLLVFSAGLMAILLFGQPVMWFIEGRKKEAVQLLSYTMVALLSLTVFTFSILLFSQH
jgi:hypothetical protein